MTLPQTYVATLVLTILTMLCWGSWANTFKLAGNWRFELFYFDYSIGVLLAAGGIRGMVGGQWLDLTAEGRRLDRNTLRQIHRRKTGALIEAGCLIGALAAGASETLLRAIAGFGRDIGLAFQIADDVLDATATTAQLGKTAGRDFTLAKSTYVSVLGVDGARREAVRQARQAVEQLARGGLVSPSLSRLAGYIVSRRS